MTIPIFNYLEDALREVGTLVVPSQKAELDLDLKDGTLWVTYKQHNPDGTYTEPISHKFKFTNK